MDDCILRRLYGKRVGNEYDLGYVSQTATMTTTMIVSTFSDMIESNRMINRRSETELSIHLNFLLPSPTEKDRFL